MPRSAVSAEDLCQQLQSGLELLAQLEDWKRTVTLSIRRDCEQLATILNPPARKSPGV
jgi:hypothetical protein